MDASLKDLLKELEDCLECPVCLSPIVKPPVFNCENGHILCQGCHESLETSFCCPVCRGALKGRRNLTVERILSKLPFQKCTVTGCDFKTGSHDQLLAHQDLCRPRKVKCYACNHHEIFQLNDLVFHLRWVHRFKRIDYEFGIQMEWHLFWAYRPKSDRVFVTPLLDHEDKVTFFIHDTIQEDRHMFWISHDQGRGQDKTFKWTINIVSGEQMSFTGFCIPITDKSLEDIAEDTDSFFSFPSRNTYNSNKEAKDSMHYQIQIDKV